MKLEKTELFQRWQALSSRERLLCLLTALIISFYSAYSLLYLPLLDKNKLLQQTIHVKTQVYQHLQQVSTEVQALRRQGTGVTHDSVVNREPMTLIENSSEQLGIRKSIKRMQSEAENQLSLWLEQVSFDQLVQWLAILELKHDMQVISAEIDRHAADQEMVDTKLIIGLP